MARTAHLQPPLTVTHRVLWRYAVPIIVLHLFALLALMPWLFSWSAVVLTIIGINVFGSGINIGYHRLLTHRSFDCPKWVERSFVTLALCCLEDAPAAWVATHRLHHKDSDEQPDPHSPLVSFWWGHMGWLFEENSETNTLSAYDRYARDVLRDRYYLWLQRDFSAIGIYLLHALVLSLAGFGFGYFWSGTLPAATQLGLSWLVWGVFLRTVIVWHITWSVNSLSHVWGYKSYATGDQSRNNWFVALIANGEGWHNNHHQDPTAASNWHHWWEFDVSYITIWVLHKLGLAYNLKPIRRATAPAPPPKESATELSV